MRDLAAFCAILLALLSSFAARAEVRDSAENGFTVVNEQQVPASPAQCWRALVRDVDKWWPKDHSWFGAEGRFSIDAKPGGCFCETAGKRQAQHLVVSHVDPGRLLRLLGGLGPLQGMGLHGVLEWSFAPLADGQTKITLRHRVGGYTPDSLSEFAPIVDRVQAQQLGALADFIRQRGG